MKLSEELQKWRAERPDEWKMDEFIRKAICLERIEKDVFAAIDALNLTLPTKHLITRTITNVLE